jgi:hypothetical protein
VLILPPGHAQAIATPRRLGRRERWMIACVLGLLAVGAVVLAISLGSSTRATGAGCVDVTAPGATGATELYRCGAQARELCTSGRSYGGAFGAALISECRKAGLPVSQ